LGGVWHAKCEVKQTLQITVEKVFWGLVEIAGEKRPQRGALPEISGGKNVDISKTRQFSRASQIGEKPGMRQRKKTGKKDGGSSLPELEREWGREKRCEH